MKTKEIIEYAKTHTVANFSDVADPLMEDAKKLIEVRRCHTVEAKKSCYEEQVTKYKSAFAKASVEMTALGWNEDSMRNYLLAHKDSKIIMAPQPQPVVQERRHNMAGPTTFLDLLYLVGRQRIADELQVQRNHEKAINDLAAYMHKIFLEFMEHCKNDATLNAEEKIKISTRGMLQFISEKMWPGMNITEMSDRMDYVGMYASAYARLRKNSLPELEELFEDKLQVLGFMTKYVSGFIPDVVS